VTTVTTIAIEINDAGLTIAGPGGILAVEPGYALVDKSGIVTGVAAYGQARLRPGHVSNRFWADLSLDTATSGIAGVRNSAELAFAQLRAIWERYKSVATDAVLVVPGHYDKLQLGILLGIAQECGMPGRGRIDAAAAASERPYPGRQLVYVDASLHRVAVTPLHQDREVTALEGKSLAALGLATLDDLFAKRIGEIFVLATRFDPFHHAQSEQALYDRLPRWLEQLNIEARSELTLPFGGEERGVEVERSHLLAAAGGVYKALLLLIAQARDPGSALAVQLSDRLARRPGLVDALARLDDAIVVSHEPGRAARGALAALDALAPGEQVKLLRHLAWRGEPVDEPAAEPRSTELADGRATPPTHVVYRGVAYPINGKGLLIGRARLDDRPMIVVDDQSSGISRSHCELAISHGELVVRDLSTHGTFVNEKRVSGQEVLHPADVIRIGSPGAELELIRVER
jgi:hypothetical protein